MKQLKFLLMAIGFLMAISVYSQEMPRKVFAAGGGQGSTGNIELSWTIGQSGLVGTFTKPSFVLNTGFQQFDNLLVSIDEVISSVHFTMYPNPFRDHFYLDIQATNQIDVNIQLFDNYGRLLISKDLAEGSVIFKQTIQTRGLTPGVYSLLVTTKDENNTISTKYFKIIKQ
jgi:hypothetical protein